MSFMEVRSELIKFYGIIFVVVDVFFVRSFVFLEVIFFFFRGVFIGSCIVFSRLWRFVVELGYFVK